MSAPQVIYQLTIVTHINYFENIAYTFRASHTNAWDRNNSGKIQMNTTVGKMFLPQTGRRCKALLHPPHRLSPLPPAAFFSAVLAVSSGASPAAAWLSPGLLATAATAFFPPPPAAAVLPLVSVSSS